MPGEAGREVKRIDRRKPSQNNMIICFQFACFRNMNMAYLYLLLILSYKVVVKVMTKTGFHKKIQMVKISLPNSHGRI